MDLQEMVELFWSCWLNKNKLKKFSLNALLNFGENNNNRYNI